MAEVADIDPWEPVRAWTAYWNCFAQASSIWWTRNGGRAAIEAACQHRVEALVEFARTHSPFYRDAYRGIGSDAPAVVELPVVNKRQLMARFEDWVTDPAIRRVEVERFLADRSHIGERYLGRYTVWKSSGTTGAPGIFIQDADALATYDALLAVQLNTKGLAGHYARGILARAGCAALITATGDHYAGITTWQRTHRGSPWFSARSYSVTEPLPKLVAELNAYQPAFLASYATVLLLLAAEQEAGRLQIRPTSLWSFGECLATVAQSEVESAFGCPVENEYGASECLSIAFGCREGWLHVNADWVLLEPVDASFRPTPPGEASYSVLLTNLANRVQPVIRYDLGDSIIAKPEPCACGNPLPAIQVEGRREDMVSLRASDGKLVRLVPMALTTAVEETSGLHRFQIVQTAPSRLMLRLDGVDASEKEAAWRKASAALRHYLTNQLLPDVEVGLDERSPATDVRSGKLRQVLVEQEETP